MSREEEAYLGRTSQQYSNPRPTGAYPGHTYNTMVPNPQPAAYPRQTYNTLGQPSTTVVGPTINPPVRRQAKKSILEAYLLWLILGLIGAHHFYLRRPFFGILYFFTFGLAGCGFLIDLFRMPYLVKQANEYSENPSDQDKKNISDAYTLWFPFGLLGFHHFYLNNPGYGVLYLCTGGVGGLGWLVDLFRIPHLVRQANEQSDMPPKKTKCTAYLLGLSPIGVLGPHHFYLNRPLFGLIYIFTLGNFVVGWIVDWFRIPTLVRRANREIRDGSGYRRYLDDAYLLWFPLGLLGIHHFYLNRLAWGFVYFFTLGLGGLGWLIDGFRMPSLVRQCNKQIEHWRSIPTTYIVTPEGYGCPVIPGVIRQSEDTGYGTQQNNSPAVDPSAGSNSQPYQHAAEQSLPECADEPPPYEAQDASSAAPCQPPSAEQGTKSPL